MSGVFPTLFDKALEEMFHVVERDKFGSSWYMSHANLLPDQSVDRWGMIGDRRKAACFTKREAEAIISYVGGNWFLQRVDT